MRNPKYNFFREDLISGEGRPENVEKIGNYNDIHCFANQWWSISKESTGLGPLVSKSFRALISLHARPKFYEKELKKTQFSAQNLTDFTVFPSLNIRTYSNF